MQTVDIIRDHLRLVRLARRWRDYYRRQRLPVPRLCEQWANEPLPEDKPLTMYQVSCRHYGQEKTRRAALGGAESEEERRTVMDQFYAVVAPIPGKAECSLGVCLSLDTAFEVVIQNPDALGIWRYPAAGEPLVDNVTDERKADLVSRGILHVSSP